MNPTGAQVSADEYLRDILRREDVDAGPRSPLRALQMEVQAFCSAIPGVKLIDVYPTGAFEKGTANKTGVHIDFLASFAPTTPVPTGDLFEALYEVIESEGHETVRRDVSVALMLGDIPVDIVPGRREAMTSDAHEIWLSRFGRPVKTNLTQHILDIRASGRREEIRVLKVWRDQQGLDFPSFNLELSVLAALRRRPAGDLAHNVWTVLGYLESLFAARSILDPANANNILSDQMSPAGKETIRRAAMAARQARAWAEIIA